MKTNPRTILSLAVATGVMLASLPLGSTELEPSLIEDVAQVAAPASGTLGVAPCANMQMRFEVTFMKIDVADIELLLDDAAGARLCEIVAEHELDDDVADEIGSMLLETDPMLIRMIFLRDAGFGRFQSGFSSGIEAARKSGLISEEQEESMVESFEREFAAVVERGVKKGDVLGHRIDESGLRSELRDAHGELLVQFASDDPARILATKGSYVSRKSRFRDSLVESLYDEEDSEGH